MKRSPMRQTSRKQADKNRKRTPVKRLYLMQHRRCEARVPGVCSGESEHCHEPWTRARGGPIDDDRNYMAVCNLCHHHIHTNPLESEERGWLIPASYGEAWLAGGGREQDRAA